MLGRAIRFQSRHTPRSRLVLLYLPQSDAGRPLADPISNRRLREAGHAVRAVTTSADFESALRSGTYDVVLANVTDAADLERARATAGQCRRPSGRLSDRPGAAGQAANESGPRQRVEGVWRGCRGSRASGSLLRGRRQSDGAEAQTRTVATRGGRDIPRQPIRLCRACAVCLLPRHSSPSRHRRRRFFHRREKEASPRLSEPVCARPSRPERRTDGGRSGSDPTRRTRSSMEAEFGLTDRLAVSVSLPYIRSKYGGSTPHLVGGSGRRQEWDDGEYHGTFQDFRFGVRFNVITPPVRGDAICRGHHSQSSLPEPRSRGGREGSSRPVVGGAVGGFLDAFLPGLFFQARFHTRGPGRPRHPSESQSCRRRGRILHYAPSGGQVSRDLPDHSQRAGPHSFTTDDRGA